mmetsp:Transcript_35737/g.43135  ORF Transcript_35737/g.43135 Transcript_35737/m.43135 type:complete len:405 (-) Transcript_35737:706-1920(-)|eukprot:CAMPEP_0197857238 /NCGR_PEP_ID=MMETSP1438-20131217/30102_1 /TAXON_ID=1461541 /ORGANISM="Pterosperma sp., Strain CCMP1384" /LENGTH=404 /DNA_ID=CAMNT_0043472993 /DNA_START=198 /DNA_END=1412 /DNA_ORIENTATION=+
MGGERKKDTRDKKSIIIVAGVVMVIFCMSFLAAPFVSHTEPAHASNDVQARQVAQLTGVIQKLQAKIETLEANQGGGMSEGMFSEGVDSSHVEEFVANDDVHMEIEAQEEPEEQGGVEVEEHQALQYRKSEYTVSETKKASGLQKGGKHSWTNPNTKDTYMKMYNEYHRLRSGADSCHGCRYLPAVYKQYPKINSVFDAGCGTGNLVRDLLKAGKEAYGVEAASLPLETYASDLLANKTVFIRPLHDTPFKSEYFDFIISTEVFEHVPMADVDRSVKELIRIAKPNAKMFFTIGMGPSRFDTKDGRKKSEVAEFAIDFKFHETVQSRKWWLDTFCALGLYEDVQGYKNMVSNMAKLGHPQNIPPRGWFALQKGKIGSKPCKCTVAAGRKADIWCGPGRKTKVEV